MYQLLNCNPKQVPWNKGKLVGQKLPLTLQERWAIRTRLQLDKRHRDLALFNLAIDSNLRACDLLKLRVSDVSNGGPVGSRAMIMRGRPSHDGRIPAVRKLWWRSARIVPKATLDLFRFDSV